MTRRSVWVGVLARDFALWLPAVMPTLGYAVPTNCFTCHSNHQNQLAQSVHTRVTCQECHGGEEKYEVASDPGALKVFDHGSKFRGPVDRAAIPTLCGDCHADVARMNPYGLRTDQLAAYWTSGHGRALKERGETAVAVCIDCHGAHDIMKPSEPTSRTNPVNVPSTCGKCHSDQALMGRYKISTQIVDEYRRSVHGEQLQGGDTGAPQCATCHGNHAAAPPGFASVGSVCGQCHEHASKHFAAGVHAQQPEFHGCVQCHGGGPDAHFHLIERITKPPGILIQRYAHLMKSDPRASSEEVSAAIHADPKEIMRRALPSCLECHESVDEDESLQKFFRQLYTIADAERKYVETAHELDRVGQGVLLVDNQRFAFEDAKTHLIALAPLQHALNPDLVAEKVTELNTVCDNVTADLARLEDGLNRRYRSLLPMWAFAIVFSALLYAKYKALRKQYVTPLPKH